MSAERDPGPALTPTRRVFAREGHVDSKASCPDRHIGYLTWNAAKQALSHLRKKARRGRGQMAPYRCRFCSDWHLGSVQ